MSNPSTRISAEAATQAIADGALLIDVRSAAGRAKNGEVAGAVVIAKSDVLNVLSKLQRIGEPNKIVVFCGSIAGSGPVLEQLTTSGFTNAYDVDGGFPALVEQGATVIPPPVPAA
jgi:rhodanese-related sulfurtransferase